MQDAQKTIRLLQITDCHISEDPDWQLAGIKTELSFKQVLEQSTQKWPKYDLAIFTGDLVHDSSDKGYQRFRKHLEQLPSPSVCLPGNHDITANLVANLDGGKVSAPKAIHLGPWLIILLDSTLGCDEEGRLDAKELKLLKTILEQNSGQFTLICLHHHPVPIGSRWMDRMALQNPEQFFDVVDQFSQVKGIIWGHIHQPFEDTRNGVKLLGSPSTCIQFAPKQDDFGVDSTAPGYRWLELLSDGSINTGIEYSPRLPQGLDLNSNGY